MYARHVEHKLTLRDRFSCQNRVTLIRNQRLVLTVLYNNTGRLASLTRLDQRYFVRVHRMLRGALMDLERTPTCRL